MIETRLAKLVAQFTDANGQIDRQGFYEALMVQPTDPITLTIESFLAQSSTAEDMRQANGLLIETMDDRIGIVRDRLAEHADRIKAANAAVGKLIEDRQGALLAEVRRFDDSLARQNAITAESAETARKLKTSAYVLAFAAFSLAAAAITAALILKR